MLWTPQQGNGERHQMALAPDNPSAQVGQRFALIQGVKPCQEQSVGCSVQPIETVEHSLSGSLKMNQERTLGVPVLEKPGDEFSLLHGPAHLLAWSPSQLMVDVIDNGIGFSVEEKRNGVGWWNIQHRADSIHALIQLGEIPTGRGAHVTLHIPLDDEK